MDNKELESLLKSRFKSANEPVAGASLVPGVMARVAAGADTETAEPEREKSHDWVLAFAWLLGALVCVSSLQGLDVQALLTMLPLEVFGSYAQTAATLAIPLLGFIAILPVAWLAIED